MKLYTEEQVRKAIKLAQECDSDCGGVYFLYENPDGILEELTPIELPSDEEILKYVKEYVLEDSVESTAVGAGFIIGSKWIIDKLNNRLYPDLFLKL